MLYVIWWTCTCTWKRNRSCRRIRVPQSLRDVIILETLRKSVHSLFNISLVFYEQYSSEDLLELLVLWCRLFIPSSIELVGETTIVSDWDHHHCTHKISFQPRQFSVNLASVANRHGVCWRVAILRQRDALWFSKSYKSRGLLNWPHSD
jgi:hypothetical protein